MKKNQKLLIAIIAIVIIIILISIILILFNKKDINEIGKFVENNNQKITISKIAKTQDYLIIEYDVDIKNTEEEITNNSAEFTYPISRKIETNGIEIGNKDYEINQMAYKISENKAKVYDIINITDTQISDKLQISIYDSENTYESDIESEEMTEENIEETTEGDIIDEPIQEEILEESDPSEEIDEKLYEEAEKLEKEQYEKGIEYDEENKIGIIEIMANEIEQAETIEDNEIYKLENETVEIELNEIIKTSFGKFLIINTNLNNISSSKIQEDGLDDPLMFSLNIQDENGNTISTNKLEKTQIYTQDNEEWNGVDELENGIAKITTILSLVEDNKNIEKIRLQPYYLNMLDEENVSNKTWYKIENKTFTNENRNGGKVEITQIDIQDQKIIFYYKTSGFISESEPIILIRNINREGNYVTPYKTERKGNREFTAEFDLDGEDIEEESRYLDNIENLEFTIFEDKEEIILNENLEVEI